MFSYQREVLHISYCQATLFKKNASFDKTFLNGQIMPEIGPKAISEHMDGGFCYRNPLYQFLDPGADPGGGGAWGAVAPPQQVEYDVMRI